MRNGKPSIGSTFDALMVERIKPLRGDGPDWIRGVAKVIAGAEISLFIPADGTVPKPGEWFKAHAESYWPVISSGRLDERRSLILSKIDVQPFDVLPRGLSCPGWIGHLRLRHRAHVMMARATGELEMSWKRSKWMPYGCAIQASDDARLENVKDNVLFVGSKGPINDRIGIKIDPVARTYIEFARDHLDGVISEASGGDDFLTSIWAHAQLANVVVLDSHLPDRKGEWWHAHSEERLSILRHHYAAQGREMSRYEPPASIRTVDQFRYARQRAIENSRR